jgi:hypothetical protein
VERTIKKNLKSIPNDMCPNLPAKLVEKIKIPKSVKHETCRTLGCPICHSHSQLRFLGSEYTSVAYNSGRKIPADSNSE